MLPGMSSPMLAAGGLNPAAVAAAYFAAMTTQESAPRKTAIQTFLNNGSANGWLIGRDRIIILCQTTQQAALLNVMNPAKSCTLPFGGFNSQLGANNCVLFNEPLITTGTKASRDNVSFSAYQNQANFTAGNREFICEPSSGTIYNRVAIENNPGVSYVGLSQVSTGTVSSPDNGGTADSVHLGASRGSAANARFHRDSTTTAYASAATTTSIANIRTHAAYEGSTAIAHRLALLQTGTDMPPAMWASYHADVVTLLTALGAN